ncbi:V-type ATP synthase subunit I [Synergistales bacterium]|nr:V-type ATP synthase subunit I [Synergistales bacterium]
MGVAELKKAELYYHKSVRSEVAKVLQESGVCQVVSASLPETVARAADWGEKLALYEEQVTHIRYLFRTLGSFFIDPISSFDRMLGERPVLSMADMAAMAATTDLGKISARVKDLEVALSETRVASSQHKVNKDLLLKLKDFPYSLSVVGDGTRSLKGVVGTLRQDQLDSLIEDLKPLAKETELFVCKGDDDAKASKTKSLWCVLMYAPSVEQRVLDTAVHASMSLVEAPAHITGSVSDELKILDAEIAKCDKKEAEILESLKKIAAETMPTAQKLSDYWNNMVERARAMLSSDTTESTLITHFWIPTESLPEFKKKIEAVSPDIALFDRAPIEGETPPTLMKNIDVVRPFEILTGLYSPPPYGETDPTPLLAPFFFAFFGICLGDAGYAIVMMAAMWLLFRKYKRVPKTTKDFIMIFAYGAVATLIYGVLTGSFFGDFIDAFFFMAPFRAVKNAIMIMDPMKDPMLVLGFSLVFGIVHLMFGLLVGAYDHFRHGNYADAIGDKISWFLFIVGLSLFGLGTAGALPGLLFDLSKVMSIVGAILVFWYAGREKTNIFSKIISGLLALYGATSYLGDILSYSRLLALGFGSAVIGMIINLLGGMASGIPAIGWLVAITVIVGGHMFGLIINVLGSFVHPLRLQYVEFFGKFYTGGGLAFKPLGLSSEYVDIAK